MPKPKKDKEKKTSGAGGWDWSSFATEPSTPAKTTSQPQQPQNKGAGWDWSTLPTNQADETRRQQRELEQRQAGQREAARYAAQDRVISAGRYAADAMRDGLRALGMGRDYTADDLEIQSDRYRRDYQRYTEMARDARQYRDADLLSMAQNGLRHSGDAYNDSYQHYLEAQQQARDKRNQELKETNKAQWYGENLSREQIEGQLRQLEQRKAENARSAELATEAAKNDPNRAAVYSSQVGDGREPWYTRALWNANDRNDEIDAEIARYQAALRYRESLDRDNEMAEMARSISSASNFRQMSEIGRDMVEKRNQKARETMISPNYTPDDPDDNRQFAIAERKEREALLAAGYVSDLDSSYIPEEVKPVYYALFAQSPAKAKAFAEYWAEKGEQAYWNEIYEKSGEDAGTRARAFIEGTFANTVAGLAPFEEGGQYAAKLGRTMIGGGAAGLTEKGLFNTGFGAGTYHSDLFGDISLGSAYQLGSSMLQSAANATLAKMTGGAAGLVGGAGTILLGSSAAAQDYQEKIEQGWDESSAKLHALAAGAAESVFEYVSLDKLIDQDITRGFLRNILTQGGVEASEEALTTISNRITDAVISEATGNENQIETKTRELVEKGYELGTAEKMAQQEWLTELMSDALGGFVSGGLMSSGQYAMYPVYKAIGAVQTNRYNERTGALSSRTGEAAALAQYAADNNLEWASPEQSAEPVKSGADSTKTNLNESTLGQQVAEAAEKNKSRQELRQERKANRQTGADVNRARSHIQKQLAGKTVQEQQTVRDELIQKYGEAIAPTVSRAITMETAKQAAQMDSTDAIRKAREAALAEISDEDMKRDVADGYDQAAYAKINQSGSAYEADRYIQQLRTTGTGNMSMEATVSAQDGQSRQIAITGMTEDGKGVKLADGSTVAVSKLQADADTMDVIQQMADLDMGQDADEVFQAYQRSGVTGTEGYRWLMNYATAYNQGRVNSVSLEEAVARSSLDDRTVLEAYTLGQRSAHRETQQGLERLEKLPKKKGVTGKTSKIDTDEIKGETMNDSERQQFDYANRIVSALGVNLTWFSSKADAKGRIVGKNGAYENGTIYIDIHAGRNFESDLYSGILATMSHELSHFQQQYAPREYQALKQFLFRQIAQNSKGGEDALERLIWEKQRRSGNKLSRRQAEDEVVADACQKMIRDSKAIHEFAREHESAVAGMVRWLKDWFKKLRAIFNRSSATFSREAELMDKLEADVKKAFGELWDKGITEAVRVHDEVGDVENSQGQNSVRPANELYQTEFDFTEPMTTDEFRKLIKQENDASKYFPNGLSPEFMKAITKKSFFTRPKLYRGIDASEFDFIAENGYIKSNNSYNFDDQQDQTFSDEDAGYALSYATGFAPNEISKRHYEDGQPSYLIEFINSPDLNMSKNGVQESSTYGNIDQKFITRIFEIMYDPKTDNDMIQEVTNDASIRSMFPQLGKGLEGLSHGRPMFYRDKTSGTILYAVQGPDGWENGEYISEKFPGAILNYDRARENNTIRFFGVSGNEADLEPMEIGKDGKLVPVEENNGVRVVEYKAGDDADRLAKVNSVEGAQFSERDYSLPSDQELMNNAVESLSEAGGEEYWKALLESAPELAGDREELRELMKANRAAARKLAETEAKLEEARRQMKPGGNRKLNTRGIVTVTQNIMKDLHAGDAKNRGVAKGVTQILTDAYQKGLDAIDADKDPGEVWDIVFNEGVMKATDYLLQNATYAEKHGRGWITSSLGAYMPGEDGRFAVMDAVSARVVMDWGENRVREAMQATIADRLIERTENRMQKQIDAATERANTAEQSNKKLSEDLDFWKSAQDKAAKQVTFLDERLKEARDDLKTNRSASAKEQKAAAAKAETLANRLTSKRREAAALKKMAEHNESLLRAALRSKNADLEAQSKRAETAEARLASETVNARAWERNADLYAKQLDKEMAQKAKIVKQLEAQVEREKKLLAGTLKPPAMQRLLKAARDQATKDANKHKDEAFQKYKERQTQSRLRSRIKNLADDMKRKMTNPSERSYVPASLYSSMTLLCDALDDLLAPNDGTKAAARYRAVMDRIHGLSAEYQAVKNLDDPTFSSEYDEEIQYEINEIIRTLQGYDEEGNPTKFFTKVRELTTGELQKVYDIMKYINYCMTTAKDLMGSSQYKTVFDAMRAVADQQRSLPQLLDVNGVKRWNRSRLLDNLSVMRAVEMMSGWDRDAALYQLMHNIEQGTDASWAWVMDYNKSQQALKTGKNEREYREALTKKLDYGVTDEEGRKVLMTKLQALQILMTAEREAHNDKLLHLQAGGAKIRDAIDLQNGKGAQARSQTIQVTPELIQRIQESVTDWDRAYMKNVRDYFRKEGKRTNEILYKLKHRVLQTEDYYVPYKVDDNYLETKLTEQQAMNMWVNTPGSTNALKQKAKQPVIIDGMDTVMGHHVKEMGDYIGLAIPIRDFSKVYNGRLPTGNDNPLPVKKTIDDTFGKKGQHLLTQAVIDVQGGSGGQNWRSGISDFLNKLQGAFVRSALLINPSVTIKQAASYIAAESVLSHRALVAGNRATFASTDKTKSPALIAYLFANPEGKTAQRIYNEIDEHTSLHYQRRQGMSQAEIANEANRNGRVKRWMNGVGARMEQNRIGHAVRKAGENLNPVTWIQRMDVATTATLWVACKEQAKMDGMKAGTAEFWQRTTELYERVIRETQPMYDGLHRTAHQKQAGTLTQYLFPFRTVPIQNHGQLAASYEALKASKNKSKAQQAEARKFFAKTVWAQAESAFIFSLMTFIAAALKRKTKKYRDEDEELSAGSVGMGLGKDVLSTLFSVLQPMYGSELVSLGSRALDKFDGSSGYTYDAFSVGVVDMINDMASAGDKLLADAGKLHRGENVSLSDVGSHGLALLMKAAKLAGIPADTIKTYYEGLLGNVEDALNGRIPALNDESWERSAAVNAERYLKAWIAGDLDKVDSVEAEMLGNYTEAGKSEEKANEAMKAKMTATAKAAWESGQLDEQDAIDFLTETGYYDEDEAWKTVQRWEGNAAHKGEEDYTYSQYEDLNDDLSAGKSFAEAAAEYLEHGYKEENLRENAVKNAKKRYQAGDLTENEAIDLLLDYAWKKENGQYRSLTKDEAWMKVKEWRESADYTEEDGSWGQYDAIDEALAGNKDIKALVSELTAHGVEEKNITQHVKGYLVDRYVAGQTNETQLKNQLSRYLGIVVKADVDKILKDANSKKLYGVEYGKLDEEYRAGKIGKAEIKKALMQQGGMSSADADLKIRWYDLQKANPKLDISEAVCNAWYDGTTNGSQKYGRESARSAGMSIERYVEARKYLDTIKDSNGNGTGEDEVIRALAGMSGLTSREKDALYYERYKGGARKGIYKTW